ncbi:MAG: DegV family protein [Clostridiaceae bacterium]|nr:DegV family protein [Eubacteriales bacterium]
MQPYVILTDADSELPLSIVKRFGVHFVPMPYNMDGEEYAYDLGEATDYKHFFERIRTGSIPTTTTYPPQYYVDMWKPYLDAGQDILFLSFSSMLSAAYGFLCAARDELIELYPGRKLIAVDTKSISAGMAALVYEALKMKERGVGIDAVAQWVEQNAMRANVWFTVDDLNHLKRGGRLSSAAAAMGTLLNVKPIITMSRAGRLVPGEKVNGRRKAIRFLADAIVSRAEDPGHNALFMLHGDCEEDAYALKALVEEQGVKFGEYFIQFVGPVIGAHTGAQTLGVGFFGKEREIAD